MKNNILKSLFISVILLAGTSNVWGATSSTFYLAIEHAKMYNNNNCCGAQFNIKYGGGNSEWKGWTTMEKTDKTYNGKILYKTTYSFPHNGYYNWQFRMEESGNQHWYKEVYAGSWNTTLHNNQIYDYENAKWVNYTCDDSFTVYFVNKDNWSDVKAYAWNGNCDNNADYPGASMTQTDKTYNGYNIYSITLNKRYANILFNGSNGKTSDLSCYSNKDKMYYNNDWIDYTHDVTVTFDENGHGTKPTAQRVIKGSKITEPTALSATGYTFGGWYKEAACTNKWNFTTDLANTDLTLYAKWSPISYNINYTAPTNGTYTIQVGNKAAVSANTTANYKETITLVNTPNKGYLFDKWTITPTVSITNSKTFLMPANDVTVAASFKPTTYTITYHLNGGENHASNPETYTIEQTITLQAPTKNEATFEGWYSHPNFAGEKITTIAQGTTGDIELYAKWAETTYAVNIYSNNINYGITTPSGARWVGATPLELIATPHTGYQFTKWTTTGGAEIANLNSPTTTITATASGTATAHFAESLYNITVQSSNDAHGKVEQSAQQAGISTAITITADPMEGYEFTGWSKDGDITIANINSATTTLTATSAGIVTANFAPKGSTPIYFKANHRWKQADAHFAVYYWDDKGKNGWDKLEEICGEDYYKAEVPAGYTEFKFVRLDQTGTMNWDHDWNESVKHEVPTDGKTMFDTKKVYFRPNNNWKSDNARFAAYFLKNENNSINKWMSLLPTETDGLYWCDLPTTDDNGTPQYFDRVIFCRMDPTKTINSWDNRWNEAETQDILNINCFTINEGQWGKENNNDTKAPATGYWSLVNDEATYDVTLYSCSFGEYGFICNNQQYTSPASGSVTYQVPVNATVKVYSEPYSKEYRGDVMVNQSGTKWEITPDNPLLNITCNTILDDNYKTTGEHEVYLAIPNNGGSWVKNAASLHYLYAFHDRTESGKGIPVQMTEVGHANVKLNSQNVDHIYYRCVIPAEVNTIRFEKRSNATTTVLSTIDLRYDIPLNSVNCYRLDRKGNSNQSYAGVWEQAPGFGSDFRLVHYRTAKDIYYSDIIRYGTISQVVSLHISTKDANAKYPKLELQQRNAINGEWVPVSGQTKLVQDINRIMNDKQDNGCGVWNFTVTTNGANDASVNFSTPQRYTGNYYIRTNNAEGEWRNYTLSTNHMTFSSYAKNHSEYTHYYCRYIDLIDNSTVPGHNKNVKFIIANDYAAVLSNEMTGDSLTTSGGDLPESANVRWTWDEITNKVSRAYILGSHGTTDHIVANGKRLEDQEDWIYEVDITGVTKGTLLDIQATYPSTTKDGVSPLTQTFAEDLEMIHTDAGNSNEYTVRVMYDFKINKTLIMLLPDQADPANIGVDVLINRTDQGEATQVRSTVTSEEGYTVYSTLTLTKKHLTSTTKTEWERLYYWISFPFDVRISEIFGFGEYGKHYIIQYYDGAERAKNGCWADSPTYWRNITDTTYSKFVESEAQGNEDANGNPNNGILVANKGYVLALARNIANSNIFDHGNDSVRLYFPSREKIKSIDGNMQNTSVYLMPHTCTIEREERYIYDSNWHIIGVPSYANKEQTLAQDNLLYFYTYNTANNTYTPTSAKDATVQVQVQFKSMHAYMVQYAGEINWKSWSRTQEPQSVVARQQSAETQEDYALRLELQRDGQYADQAFVQLKAEGATADFDMNQDLTKIINAGANIYTLAGEKRIQVAGNVLPIAKTTIPVGIQVAQAGTYTIALPEGTSGISTTLVDNQTGTHTNLLLEDYTITLDAGSHENRFYIVLDPERTATAVENIGDAQGDKAQKFLIDGQLIIRTEQGVYDATGGKVK